MIDLRALFALDHGQPARTVHLVAEDRFQEWLDKRPVRQRTAAAAQKLRASNGAIALVPGDAAEDWSAVVVVPDPSALTLWSVARLAEMLPGGS